jgi:hypothetical protein
MYMSLPKELIALILAHLPWEEDSDLLLPLYPFAEPQWRSYTSFTQTITGLNPTIITFYVNGICHRTDGPAETELYRSKGYIKKYYYQNKLHRLDGPAIIGSIESLGNYEQYYHMGLQHRIDGPAYIHNSNARDSIKYQYSITNMGHFNSSAYGVRCTKSHCEIYYNMGLCHRLDGPAFIHTNHDNETTYTETWIMGVKS